MNSTNAQPRYAWQHGADIASIAQDRCPVCDVELNLRALPTTVLRLSRGHQPWVKCPNCHGFFAAEPYDAEREVGHARTRVWGKKGTGVLLGEAKEPLFNAILRVLRDAAPIGGTLLDVGCSYGTFLERASNEGYRVQGVDIVPEAVEYVRSRGFACDLAASVADLDVPNDSQDVISVLDCNYYWPNQRRELRAIRTRLRPGGLLVMRVVDTSWAVRVATQIARVFPMAGRKLFERVVYDHRVSIPVPSLLQVIREEGFSTIYTSVRDAIPFRHNPLQARLAYAVGGVCWRFAGFNVAPGLVILARKKQS